MAGRVETYALATPVAGPATGHRATIVRVPRPATPPVLADLGVSGMPALGEAPGDVPAVVVDRRDDGFEAGYGEGLAAARVVAAEVESRLAEVEAARAAAQELLSSLTTAVAAIEAAASEVADATVGVTVDAVLELVEAVVGREVEVAGGRDALARAAAAVPAGVSGTARFHPDDLASLGELDHPSLTFEADPAMERGGCVVELADATVDARVGPALDRVRAALLGDGDGEVTW